LRIVMTDYRFDHPAALPSGRAVVRVRNAGREDHDLTFLRLPPDFSGTIDGQLRSSTRRALPTVTVMQVRHPGANAVFALDLEPGRYAMFCAVKDAEGTPHFLKGMSSELRVR